MSTEPAIGPWLWALQDSRQRTLEALEGLSPALVDWMPAEQESSIGTILYHLADIEADWLYVEVLEQPFPAEVAARLNTPTRDEHGQLTQMRGDTLSAHLDRLVVIRKLLMDVYEEMDIDDYRRVRSLPDYDVTPEWVLHYLMQHEAEHRNQIGWLRIRGEIELGSR